MNKKTKHGFTIVELVIVIAVIGILSAILIPTFISLNDSAKEASEKTLIRNVNLQLAAKEADEGKNELLRYAIQDAADMGYDILGFKSDKHELMYNEETDRFYLVNKDMSVFFPKDAVVSNEKYHTWRFIKNNQISEENKEYSFYALNNFVGTEMNIYSGFDAGTNWTINQINLDTTSRTGTEERKLKLVTNGFIVNINAPYDDVSHYRYTYQLTVTAVNENNCYHEHGFIENLVSFESGKFIAHEDALFHEKKNVIVSKLSGKNYELRNDDVNFDIEKYYDEERGETAERFIDPPDSSRRDDEIYNEEAYTEPNDDIQELVNEYPFDGHTSYTSYSRSFFNYEGLKQYFRHYYRNYIQEKVSFYTEKSYYSYPKDDRYLDVYNHGYVNVSNNYYSFKAPGTTVQERLNSSIGQANLRIEKEHANYQDDMFTLNDVNEQYLVNNGFKKVGENKYMSTNNKACNDFMSVCAPNLVNKGSYMTFSKVVIETYLSDLLDIGPHIRIRLYASPTQSGKLISDHLDEVNKPNWYMLFSETFISNIGETFFHPTDNTSLQG